MWKWAAPGRRRNPCGTAGELGLEGHPENKKTRLVVRAEAIRRPAGQRLGK